MLQVNSQKRTVIAALMLVAGSVPWLLTLHWRAVLVGVLAVFAAMCLFVAPRTGRVLLLATCGISGIVFFIAGLHREGTEIAKRPYIGMPLLTPLSIIALVLTLRGLYPPKLIKGARLGPIRLWVEFGPRLVTRIET